MATDSGSKTEKATPKKRRDERKEGNIFQSRDVVNVVFILVVFYAIGILFPYLYDTMSQLMQKYIYSISVTRAITAADAGVLGSDIGMTILTTIVPFGLICALLSIILYGVQTRFLFTSKQFYFKFNRLSPLQGIKKIFSTKNFVELIKNLLKMAVLIALLYYTLSGYTVNISRTMDMDIFSSVSYTFKMTLDMIFNISLIFAVIAFFDYMLQKWDYERKIRMSKHEVKEEYKQTEGNPEIKGRIREIQRQRARTRMMQAVPNADVIIRNPTHYAVALAYSPEKNMAPVVLALGQDSLALRIIEKGKEHDVTIVENRPLARQLYEQSELNKEIPAALYGAIAEVLVYVYKLKNKI